MKYVSSVLDEREVMTAARGLVVRSINRKTGIVAEQ